MCIVILQMNIYIQCLGIPVGCCNCTCLFTLYVCMSVFPDCPEVSADGLCHLAGLSKLKDSDPARRVGRRHDRRQAVAPGAVPVPEDSLYQLVSCGGTYTLSIYMNGQW